VRGLVVALGLAGFGIAAADPSAKMRADKLFEDGRRYLTLKEYALACTAFEQSQQADPAIGTQLNIGLCYEQWGRLATAYTVFADVDQRATAAQDKRGAVARKHLAELDSKIGRLKVELPVDVDPYAIFLLDGQEITAAKLGEEMILEAGTHTLETRVPGVPPSDKTIELAAGAREHLRVEVASKPRVTAPEVVRPVVVTPIAIEHQRSTPRLYGGIVLVTGGAIAVGIASFVALGARSDYRAAALMCPDRMCDSPAAFQATRAALDRANAMTWVFAAGAGVAIVGGYLLATSGHTSTEPRISAAPVVTSHAIGIAIAGTL
jgi:tetratricopeptide (TPR) repeat protein